MKSILALLIGILILSGCQVGSRPSFFNERTANERMGIDSPLSQCTDTPVDKEHPSQACIVQCRDLENAHCPIPDLDHTTVSQEPKELRLSNEQYPKLGLTLSGGGSKTAPFAIGVLKRFVDNKWIFRTQYLTSVSGGSYAAFYLYYRAYRVIMAYNEAHPDPHNPAPPITPREDPSISAPDKQWPGLVRYFVDSRDYNTNANAWPYVDLVSSDWLGNGSLTQYSLASNINGCLTLTTLGPSVGTGKAPAAQSLPPMWAAQNQEVYQGWVECYQDMLMAHPTAETDYHFSREALAKDFAVLFAESAVAAPVHWFSNVLFDWKKNLSPSQYDYLHGIERTYAYFPQPGDILPKSLGDEVFYEMANCLDFKDMAEVYMGNREVTDQTIGGYLPKWVLESTGTNGNVGLNWSPKHYDLKRDVFEISFDEYGSGRFGYVRGSPSLIGLTVPYAVLASAAFADAAQRNLTIPRGALDAVLQTFDIKWGLDVANYNVSDARRYFHAFLVWPFYYLDDPTNPNAEIAANAPTIHLSDGGQSGDNLGLVAMFRRHVQNIVVVSGEYDFREETRRDSKVKVGWLGLGSLCAANYYLMKQGYSIQFEASPTDPKPVSDNPKPYNLAYHCKWDGDREVYVHDATNPADNITPFNWVRRVWVGHVVPFKRDDDDSRQQNSFPSPPDKELRPTIADLEHLETINVYYLNAALDKRAWSQVAAQWYPLGELSMPSGHVSEYAYSGSTTPTQSPVSVALWYPAPVSAMLCNGEHSGVTIDENYAATELPYSCPLINYVYGTIKATQSNEPWVFPQTSTWFTTFDNSVNLFRAYRDLGWEYAGTLPQASTELAAVLNGPPNAQPVDFQQTYPYQAHVHRDAAVCRNWVGPPERVEAPKASTPTAYQ